MQVGDATASQTSSARRMWRAGTVTLDEATLELRVDGQRRAIEAKPLALLHALLSQANAVVSKDALLAAAWDKKFVGEGSLTTAIFKLRAALGTQAHIIEAVQGVGYRIVVPVGASHAPVRPAAVFSFRPGESVLHRPQWRLRHPLGSGPGHDVWLARHEKTTEARVFKFADTAARLDALKREAALSRVMRSALGARDDIVPVLEWNFEALPYFIELPYGGPDLAAWAANAGGIAALPLAARVALVAQVATTVAAAHGAGVLHGDLKPANILVGGQDGARQSIRLVDFGAGGLTDEVEGATLTVSIMNLPAQCAGLKTGTWLYAAPEVLSGGAPTVAADVYALGILLYQVTVGDLEKPLAAGWEHDVADDLLRQDIADAASGDPVRRLASAKLLAVRLETLNTRRSAAADAVAQQQQHEALLREAEMRRLEVAACSARATSAALQARRTGLAALGLFVALAIVSALAVYAVHERHIAVTQRDRAEQITNIAEDTVSTLFNDLAHGLRDQSGVTLGVVQKLLDQAGRTVTHMARLAPEDPALQRLEARTLTEVANTYLHQGNLPEALSAGGRAAKLQRTLLANDPANAGLQLEYAENERWVGDAMLQKRDLNSAIEAYRTCVRILAYLVKAEPRNMVLRQKLARSQEAIGDVQLAQTNNRAALATYRNALELVQTGAVSDEERREWQIDLSITQEKIGDALSALGDHRRALASYQADLAIRQYLLHLNPGDMRAHRNVAVANSDVGNEQDALHDIAGALASYRAELALDQERAVSDPSNAQWQRDLAVSNSNVADVLTQSGDRSGASRFYRTALSILAALVKKDPTDIGFAMDFMYDEANLGENLARAGDVLAAYPHVVYARNLARRLTVTHPDDASIAAGLKATTALATRVGLHP